jgi:hypothetical protein
MKNHKNIQNPDGLLEAFKNDQLSDTKALRAVRGGLSEKTTNAQTDGDEEKCDNDTVHKGGPSGTPCEFANVCNPGTIKR